MSGSYEFILMPANHGVELAAIDLQVPMGEVATAFINEGPFSDKKEAQYHINKLRHGKPWNNGHIELVPHLP